jgi:hypothetical protein
MKLKELLKDGIEPDYFHQYASIVRENFWLKKLKKDLTQNKYNLKKVGLYSGSIERGIEYLIDSLRDYDL